MCKALWLLTYYKMDNVGTCLSLHPLCVQAPCVGPSLHPFLYPVSLTCNRKGLECHRFRASTKCSLFQFTYPVQYLHVSHCFRFVPDFTLSRVSNTLRIKTSEGTEMLFPLLAVLPHYTLAACYAMQPRPEWEKKVAWFSVPFWLFVLLAIFITVLVQTNFGMQSKPFHHADSELPAVEATRGQVFDLRDIITKTLTEKISALKTRCVSEESVDSLFRNGADKQCMQYLASFPGSPC